MDTLRVRTGGAGGPTVVLLHGLGATGAVWDGLTERLDRRWIAPDLPGHGGSGRLKRYSFGAMAGAVAEHLPAGEPVTVIGHSLGGVLAVALASGWFGVDVRRAVAVGVKVEWTDDELAGATAMAHRPVKIFGSKEEAAQRYLKVSGLGGLVPADPDGLASTGDGWRLALDPATFAVGRPDMRGLLAAAKCPVLMVTGENDPMSAPEQVRALTEHVEVLPDLGHNLHVEDPVTLLDVITRTGDW
ncbi:alpha/beta fold hydrolase [Kutzneria buriramensis]|uniref:alpha/beta fold hydrolase n=1 Tax=Kutzneria buriramensis TaxID=1045776 RepID=UPI000E2421CA|nr:alpha/beta hydrolase [Kutzneria buriramensis]